MRIKVGTIVTEDVLALDLTGVVSGITVASGSAVATGSAGQSLVTPITYAATIATNLALGTTFTIVVTDGVAITVSAPTNPVAGKVLRYDIKNSSGGAMGAITWNAVFLLAGAFTNPASTKRRTIEFYYDGTNWIEVCRAAADI